MHKVIPWQGAVSPAWVYFFDSKANCLTGPVEQVAKRTLSSRHRFQPNQRPNADWVEVFQTHAIR